MIHESKDIANKFNNFFSPKRLIYFLHQIPLYIILMLKLISTLFFSGLSLKMKLKIIFSTVRKIILFIYMG